MGVRPALLVSKYEKQTQCKAVDGTIYHGDHRCTSEPKTWFWRK